MKAMKNRFIKKFHEMSMTSAVVIFTILSMLLPIAVTSSIERFAPTSYFYEIQSLQVSDMVIGEWEQELIFNRASLQNFKGYSVFQLYLLNEAGQVTYILETDPLDTPRTIEKFTGELGFFRNWKTRISEKNFENLLEVVEPGQEYIWAFNLELQISEYRQKRNKDIIYIESNPFTILPEGSTIN